MFDICKSTSLSLCESINALTNLICMRYVCKSHICAAYGVSLCTNYSLRQIRERKTHCTHPTAVFTWCCYGKTAWFQQQTKPGIASIHENIFKIYAVHSRLKCYHSFFTCGRVRYNKYLSTCVCTGRLQGVQSGGSCLVDRWRLFNMRVLLHVVLEVPGNWGRCAVVVMSDIQAV